MYLGKETQSYKLISPRETHELVQKDCNVVLLDVRTPAEFNNELGHVPRSILIPLHELEQKVNELERHKGQTIIAVCRSGNRSGVAAELLGRRGFTVMNMLGGMIQWNREGLPVARDEEKV